MRSGFTALRAKGRITSQSAIIMTDNARQISNLSQKDLELIERVIYKNGDDLAVSVSRSFERIEERIDAMESRLYSRLDDLEDKLEVEED
jgi:hypothetical protein